MESNKHYRIIFKNFEILSGHVEYIINLICEKDSSINVEFKERYSNLKDLHESLKKEANSINFPKFPPKKLFGNLDEKFLNERKIKLQHYFNTILGSKDFSQLKTLNKWIETLIKKYNKTNKDNAKQDNKSNFQSDQNLLQSQQAKNTKTAQSNQQLNTNFKEGAPTPRNHNDMIQRYKEIVDKFSEKFIDLGNDVNPHYDAEEAANKERTYKNLINNDNNLKLCNSNIFKSNQNKTDFFDFMGLSEEKIGTYDNVINSKLKKLSNYIKVELPDMYIVEDLIVS